MSFSPALKAATRATYRDVLRASRNTFRGDAAVIEGFRQKIRHDLTTGVTSPESQETQNKFVREVADVLRRNVVQGTKVGQEADGSVLYRVNVTKDTELGDNNSIKNPPPVSSRGGRKTNCPGAVPSDHSPPSISTPNLPRNFSALKRAHQARTPVELREEDLEESFVRGSGPGGQSINKTENNVQLLHKPTGLRVKCQITRSLEQNRKIARKLLLEKLDKQANPGLSKEEMKAAKQRERERQRRKKAKRKAERRAGANEATGDAAD